MKNNFLATIIIALVVAAASFFAGMKYQQSTRTAGNSQLFTGRNGTRMQGMRPVTGTILSADNTTITVQMQDGSSRIVILSASTDINKATKATKEDLKTGERVAVFGTQNADGSVTAQSVQLNPQLRGFRTGQPTAQ